MLKSTSVCTWRLRSDSELTPEMAYFAATIPGAKLIILPNVSHFALWQDSTTFNNSIILLDNLLPDWKLAVARNEHTELSMNGNMSIATLCQTTRVVHVHQMKGSYEFREGETSVDRSKGSANRTCAWNNGEIGGLVAGSGRTI